MGIAAVAALVFWAMFFRSGSAPAAAASSDSAAASETAESTAASEEATDGPVHGAVPEGRRRLAGLPHLPDGGRHLLGGL